MHGIGLLSIGATSAAGFDALALHWDVMEAQAKHYKTKVDRRATGNGDVVDVLACIGGITGGAAEDLVTDVVDRFVERQR